MDNNVRGASSSFSVSCSKYEDSSDPPHDPWLCNERFSPSREGSFDGLTLMPFATMFVKFKRHLFVVRAEVTNAAKLGQWEEQSL